MRGHAAVVVAPGRTVLVTDDAVGGGDAVADEVHPTHDLPSALVEALGDAGLARRPVGVVGSDALSARHMHAILGQAADLELADGILMPLRMVKSAAEQELLRSAGRLGGAAVSAAIEAALHGACEQEAAAEAASVAMRGGAAVINIFTELSGPERPARRRPFPSYANDVPPRPGDVFAIDMSGALDGYLFDFSRTCIVGEDRNGGRRALDDVQEVVRTVVQGLRAGRTVAAAVADGRAAMRRQGELGMGGEFDALGHGLGLGFEDPWLVEDDRTELQPGMCLAVEKYAVRGPVRAAFERNVLVTEGEPEVLDTAPDEW